MKSSIHLIPAVSDVFIVAAKRTPFGTYGGKLRTLSATDLQEVAARAALAAGNIKPEWINSIIIGNVFHVSIVDSLFISPILNAACPCQGRRQLCGQN